MSVTAWDWECVVFARKLVIVEKVRTSYWGLIGPRSLADMEQKHPDF
jgi:hypothetical protein